MLASRSSTMTGWGLPTHADDGALLVEHNAITLHVLAALLDDLSKVLVEGVGESNVADNATLEEGEGADALGSVNDLVGNDKVHGLDLLLQGANGGEGNNGADTDVSQSSNVGAVGDLVRGELVVHTVAGKEGYVDIVVSEDADG